MTANLRPDLYKIKPTVPWMDTVEVAASANTEQPAWKAQVFLVEIHHADAFTWHEELIYGYVCEY